MIIETEIKNMKIPIFRWTSKYPTNHLDKQLHIFQICQLYGTILSLLCIPTLLVQLMNVSLQVQKVGKKL